MQKEKPVYRYPKDWDGLEALKKSAYESNDSFAQLHLGIIYLDGWIDGVQINRHEGKSLLTKSIANGNIVAPEAYYMYFRNDTDYQRHLIVTSLKDLIDVFSTVKTDYYNGNNLYTVLLGFMYHYGTGVEKNHAEAHRLYTLAAAEFNSTGECMSAYVYLFAVGVEQDMAMSVHYMQRAAEQGNCSAQSNLGYLYEHGFGVQEDKQRAYDYWVRAAEQGNSTSQCNLGYYYWYGTVVEKNTVTSFEYFKKSAADNDCDAQLAVGDFYFEGIAPCEKNYAEAMKWFRLSADQGNSNAFQKMACMYKDGQGVTADIAQAMRYFKLAADQDNLSALLQLSEIYQTGLPGVPVNLKESIRLLQLAQSKGDRTAQNKLDNNSSLQAFLRKEEKQSKEFHQSFERNASGVGMRKSAYEFHEKLGSGGFGVVYRATKVQSSLFSSKTVSYAIKLLNQFDDGLKMEIGVHKSLSHVNVVALHDSFISKIDNMEILHIVMELCESDLQKFLDSEHALVLPLYGSSNLAARMNLFKDWSYQMLSGLEYIHLNNLMHRDIKPGNILLKFADNKIIPKYSDFGESKFLQQQNNTNTYVGTPLYEAPELWRVTFGKIADSYTNLIDVWSLGLVLLQVLFLMPFKEMGQFLTEAKLSTGSAESRKSFVKDFCKDMVQPLIEKDFRQYDAGWVKVLGDLFGQMLCMNRNPAGVVLQSEYMKAWRKEAEKQKIAKQPKTGMTDRKARDIVQIPDGIYFRQKIEPSLSISFQKQIGTGSYGQVFLAQTHSKEELAVKKIVNWDPSESRQFSEVIIQKTLCSHPNIVHIYDVCSDEKETLFIVMERCDYDLDHVLSKKTFFDDNKFTELEALDAKRNWMMQLAEAMAFIHSKKFIHRDIKPSNLLVCQKGKEFSLKIGDFGSAKSLSTMSYRAKTGMVGSVSYNAPELWFPKNGIIEENYDNLVDVWSLGVVFLQLWVGLTTTELVSKYLTFIGSDVEKIEHLLPMVKKTSNSKCADILFGDLYDILGQMITRAESRINSSDLLVLLKSLDFFRNQPTTAITNSKTSFHDAYFDEINCQFLAKKKCRVSILRANDILAPSSSATTTQSSSTSIFSSRSSASKDKMSQFHVKVTLGSMSFQTQKRPASAFSCTWNETFMFNELSKSPMTFALMMGEKDCIGTLIVDMPADNYQTKGIKWMPLKHNNENAGSVLIQIE